jgi:predicted aspartyl protease
MRTLVQGRIKDYAPSFNGYLDEHGVLVIGEKGDFTLTVDTGFSGGIALPGEVLSEMEVDFSAYDTFSLATGKVIELPVYLSVVRLGNCRIETWFIPGDSLLGMEFLSSAGSLLSLNFRKSTVKLSR